MISLRYGDNLTVELDLAAGARCDEVALPEHSPLADLGVTTRAALDEPLEFPSLSRCITPADHVVIALDRGVADQAVVTAAVVQALVDAGVDADGIIVLQTAPEHGVRPNEPCRMIPAVLRDRVTLITHDPADRRQLAYLAANEAGDAILIHRALHEADVVLPIGCLRSEDAAGYFGIHSAVYPAFSDTKTIQKFRGLGSMNGHGDHKRAMMAEVDHVAWILGLNFTIQLVPGPGGRTIEVLAGQSDAVRKRGAESYCSAWKTTGSDRASLVVAAIEGGPEQQTWENFGRALHAASQFVEDDGAIALCCDLDAAPGPGLRRVAHASSRQSALRHLGKERPIDAVPAAQIARVLDQHTLYLLSRLDAGLVEELDIVPLEAIDELVRLVQKHPSCIVVPNAPYVVAE